MMSQRSDPEPPQLLPASFRESAGFCKLNLIHVTNNYFTSSLSVPSRKLMYDGTLFSPLPADQTYVLPQRRRVKRC